MEDVHKLLTIYTSVNPHGVTIHLNCLDERVGMDDHNVCLVMKISKKQTKLFDYISLIKTHIKSQHKHDVAPRNKKAYAIKSSLRHVYGSKISIQCDIRAISVRYPIDLLAPHVLMVYCNNKQFNENLHFSKNHNQYFI